MEKTKLNKQIITMIFLSICLYTISIFSSNNTILQSSAYIVGNFGLIFCAVKLRMYISLAILITTTIIIFRVWLAWVIK